MLQVPFFVLALLHLVLESSFFSLLLAAVAVLVKALLHSLNQSWLKQNEVPVDDFLNVLYSLDKEILISHTVLNTQTESV